MWSWLSRMPFGDLLELTSKYLSSWNWLLAVLVTGGGFVYYIIGIFRFSLNISMYAEHTAFPF